MKARKHSEGLSFGKGTLVRAGLGWDWVDRGDLADLHLNFTGSWRFNLGKTAGCREHRGGQKRRNKKGTQEELSNSLLIIEK